MTQPNEDTQRKHKDPLHGVTLEMIVTRIVDAYGWEYLGDHMRMNCFMYDPSVKSCLKFLRRTEWARTKVEKFYLHALRTKKIVL